MLLHWYMAALVLFEFMSAASFRFFNPGDLGYFHAAYRLHMSAGMSLLALRGSVCLASSPHVPIAATRHELSNSHSGQGHTRLAPCIHLGSFPCRLADFIALDSLGCLNFGSFIGPR